MRKWWPCRSTWQGPEGDFLELRGASDQQPARNKALSRKTTGVRLSLVEPLDENAGLTETFIVVL